MGSFSDLISGSLIKFEGGDCSKAELVLISLCQVGSLK